MGVKKEIEKEEVKQYIDKYIEYWKGEGLTRERLVAYVSYSVAYIYFWKLIPEVLPTRRLREYLFTWHRPPKEEKQEVYLKNRGWWLKKIVYWTALKVLTIRDIRKLVLEDEVFELKKAAHLIYRGYRYYGRKDSTNYVYYVWLIWIFNYFNKKTKEYVNRSNKN